MPWIIRDVERRIVGIKTTSPEAVVFALLDSGWTANDTETTGTDFVADAEVGWFLNTAGKTVRELDFTDLQTLHLQIYEAQTYLSNWHKRLTDQNVAHDPEIYRRTHAYIYRALQSLYLVGTDTSITVARRTTYAELLEQGPLGIDDVPTFYSHAEDVGGIIWEVNVTAAGSGYTSPPQVVIPTPESGGRRATAIASVTAGGEISGFTVTDVGWGYRAPPSVVSLVGGGGVNGQANAVYSPLPVTPMGWVTIPTAADPVRLRLDRAVLVPGTQPGSSINLLGTDWVQAIAA